MKKYNFNAGPSVLPDVVLEAAAKAIIDFDGTGLSLLSISHRTPEFEAVLSEAQSLFRELLNIPDNYKVLFLQGGVIAEEGTHEELLALGGEYAKMFQVQARYYQEGGEWNGEE